MLFLVMRSNTPVTGSRCKKCIYKEFIMILRNHTKIWLVLVCFAMVFGVTMAPSPAAAGSNGQQIYVTSNAGGVTVTSVKIEGTNHNNQFATYSANLGWPGSSSHWVSSRWWKGTVKVTLSLSIANPGISKTISCYISVPTSQSGDWVGVTYNASGCFR